MFLNDASETRVYNLTSGLAASQEDIKGPFSSSGIDVIGNWKFVPLRGWRDRVRVFEDTDKNILGPMTFLYKDGEGDVP
jgi:hypothetical protein